MKFAPPTRQAGQASSPRPESSSLAAGVSPTAAQAGFSSPRAPALDAKRTEQPVRDVFQRLESRAPTRPLRPIRPPPPKPMVHRHQTPAEFEGLDYDGAAGQALADMFAGEMHPNIADVALWRWAAPHLAQSLVQPPYDVAQALEYLARVDFDDCRLELTREFIDHIGAASSEFWPRQLVLQDAVLTWAQQRFAHETRLDRDRDRVFAQLGSVEARKQARDMVPSDETPWMQAALEALLYRAKRFDHSRCIERRASFFSSGLAFAGLHLAAGAILGAASSVAWLVGAEGCFDFALMFVGCAVGITVAWSCFYIALCLYHRYAPWETGMRDIDLEPPEPNPPATQSAPDLLRPSQQLHRRRSDGE